MLQIQFVLQEILRHINILGTHEDITGRCFAGEHLCPLFRFRKKNGAFCAVDQELDINIRTVLFIIHGTELDQIDFICLFKCLGKSIRKILYTACPVRLKDRHKFMIREPFSRRIDRHADFGRMMGVIVNDDIVAVIINNEPALASVEIAESFLNLFRRHIFQNADTDTAKAVQKQMMPDKRKVKMPERFTAEQHIKLRSSRLTARISSASDSPYQ